MTSDTAPKTPTIGANAGLWTALGVATALLFFLISCAVSYSNIQTLRSDNDKVVPSHEVISALDALLSSAQDAETGQRGFVLTGNEKYLQPYDEARSRIASELS